MPLGAFRLNSLAKTVAAGPSRTAKSITVGGSAQKDTAIKKYGTASALFGGSGDYLYADFQTSGDLAGTNVWTFECWFYIDALSGNQVILAWNENATFGTGEFFIQHHTGNGGLRAFYSGGSTGYTAISAATWYHVALTHNGTTVTLWLDGSSIGTIANTDNLAGSTDLQISGWAKTSNLQNWDGNIDEVRASDNTRYTTGFTAPTGEFTNDSNTVFLMHANGTDTATDFEDDNA